MVRIWHVPPKYLDNQRVLGEHLEIHVILSAIKKRHKKRKGGYVNHPETIKYENKVKFLKNRHDALVKEMRIRGWTKHKTPYETKELPKKAMCHYRITKNLILKDIKDLKQRWKKEGKKGGRKNIKLLERKLSK